MGGILSVETQSGIFSLKCIVRALSEASAKMDKARGEKRIKNAPFSQSPELSLAQTLKADSSAM